MTRAAGQPPWWRWFEPPKWWPMWTHRFACSWCRDWRRYDRPRRRKPRQVSDA